MTVRALAQVRLKIDKIYDNLCTPVTVASFVGYNFSNNNNSVAGVLFFTVSGRIVQ